METTEQRQWQQEEEEEEEEEEVVVERTEALQGRPPRHPTTTTTTTTTTITITTAATSTIAISDDSNGDGMLNSAEPANGFQEQEYQEEELPNGNEDEQNVEVDEQERSERNVFYDKDEGSESIYGIPVTENSSVQGSVSENNPGDDELVVTTNNVDGRKIQHTVIDQQYEQKLKENSFSDFRLLPSENSFEEDKANKSFSEITVACDDTELIKDSDQELTELDLERVLEKQDTHDLYCPNCNSCITRRVILRKRKRKIQIFGEDVKRNRLEAAVSSKLHAISVHATNDQGRNAVYISLDGNPTPAADENDHDREPKIFRCLSCFSFFIPTGDGFKLFKIFGDKREKENMENPQQISVTKKNWIYSIFASHKEEMLIEQGSGHRPDVEENIVAASKQEVTSPPQSFGAQGLVKSSTAEPLEHGDDSGPSSMQGSKLLGKVVTNGREKLDDVIKKGTGGAALFHPKLDTVDQLNSSSFLNEMVLNYKSDHPATQLTGKSPVHTEEPAENPIFKPQQDGLKILVHASAESTTVEKSLTDQKLNMAIERKSADDKDSILLLPKPVSVPGELNVKEEVNIGADLPTENGQNVGVKLPTNSTGEDKNEEIKVNGNAYPSGVSQHSVICTKVDIHIEEPLKADRDAFSLSVGDALLLPDRQVDFTKDLKDVPAKSSAGSDTIIIVKEEPVEPAASQEAQAIIASAETGSSPHMGSAEARQFQGLDVIKSIVYGGLIESLTSLSIVSSAAGADAATLNILALGLANLIGGLFIIGHNLWELKNDESVGASNQVTEGVSDQLTKQVDKYQELLGRRENFLLHATVAVLSFIIFGLLPPVIYGFSFRESDNRDFKLIAVAVASLLCVIVLATGKTYVQRPPKTYVKTVMYYVIMGFMASGVSYAAGDLIKELLQKLSLFNSGSVLTLPILETPPTQPAWESY